MVLGPVPLHHDRAFCRMSISSQFQGLDGFTYLGFFQRVFFGDKPCRSCHRTAVGFCVLIGRGEQHFLRLCEMCGQLADEHMKKGLRRTITPEDRRRIVAASEGTAEVSLRMGVSTRIVNKIRLQKTGIVRWKKVSQEIRTAILNSDQRTNDLARQYGLHSSTVSRIRHGK